MLIDLTEWEAGRAALPLTSWLDDTPPVALFSLLSRVDFLFFGRCPDAPALTFAGATVPGLGPVSGIGASREAAFWGVAGEVAERIVAREQTIPETNAFGAALDPETAQHHARLEALERYTVRNWWAGHQNARVLQDDGALQILDLPTGTQDVHVHVAVSFRGEDDFCFGAAARTTPTAATEAARRECRQSQVGLAIARYKARKLGAAALTAHDKRALQHAARVRPADITARVAAAYAPETINQHSDARIAGQADGLWVATATIPANMPPKRDMMDRFVSLY